MTLSTQGFMEVEVNPETCAIALDSEPVVAVPRSEEFYTLSEAEVVVKFDPMIHKLLKKKQMFGWESSDVCEETDDVIQYCREQILKAYRGKKYDPSRGSISNYIYRLIDSRLGNYRNKVTRKNREGTVSLSEMDGWAITGGGSSNVDDASPYHFMAGTVMDLSSVEDSIAERMDAQNLFNRLTGLKKMLYHEYYILGLSVLEIYQRHPEIKYHKIRRELRLVMQFHDTLVKGE